MLLETYPPRKASERLIHIARERADGGGDNCTLAIVRMEPIESVVPARVPQVDYPIRLPRI